MQARAKFQEMRREGGVVRLGDPICLVVSAMLERLVTGGRAVVNSVGGGRVCPVFVVASCFVIAAVVWIAVGCWAWGCRELRARFGRYEEVGDATGLLPIVLTTSVGGSLTFCKYARASVSSSNSTSSSLFA